MLAVLLQGGDEDRERLQVLALPDHVVPGPVRRRGVVLVLLQDLLGGLKEVLGQKGLTVSGGQKQRLAIARALAGKPDLLLMDDCTASLDAENERRFWNMFSEKFPETSCLIVTHRLATARQADVIYVLYDGKIVGRGTHIELLQTCEQYQNFLTRDELAAAMASAKSA